MMESDYALAGSANAAMQARVYTGPQAIPPGLAKDMPLTSQLAESLSGQLQQLEVIGKTLMEAHQRLFGPVPPSPDGANSATTPQPDTMEAQLLGACRGVTDRLYVLQHVANCLARRI